MITIAIQSFFLAKGRTVVVLIAALIIALSNVFLDYGLIFGEMGLPEMGLKGAALASTIADGFGMLLLVYLFSPTKNENTDYFLTSPIIFNP